MNQFLAVDILDLTLDFFVLVTGRLGFCASAAAFFPKPASGLERLCGLLELSGLSVFFFSLACLLVVSFFFISAIFFFAWLFMDSVAFVDGSGFGSSFAVTIFLTQSLISLLRTTTFPAKVPANLDTVSTVSKSSDLWLSIILPFFSGLKFSFKQFPQ